jgi:hypothetical protein
MTSAAPIDDLLARVAREVRLRRAQRAAWRGAFWGALASVAVLAARAWVGDDAPLVALAVLVLCMVIPALAYASFPVAAADAARLADRAYGLQDRIPTALEWRRREERTPLSDALLADTASRVEALPRRSIVPRSRPREYPYLPVPLLAAAVLLFAPPLPHPSSWLGDRFAQDRASRDRRSPSPLEELARLFRSEPRNREALSARDAAQRASENKAPTAGDQAEFKDRSLAKSATDFASFVKKGDDRLRLLERTDRLPDLQSDFASSKYRTMLRRTQELSAGKGPGQMSNAKLGQILREMERLGRRGGDWSDDVQAGLDALEEGAADEAMEAMESALGKMRDAEERQRASRSLKGGPDRQQSQQGSSDERDAAARSDQDRRGSYSLAQSKGGADKGKPSGRLRSTPYDSALHGQRRGRMPNVDTQMTSRPGGSGYQAQYLGEIGQYRRLMEDAIAREQVPRAYHDQIRDYFKSLHDQ